MGLKLYKPKTPEWSSTPVPISFWSMAWKCPIQAGYQHNLTNTNRVCSCSWAIEHCSTPSSKKVGVQLHIHVHLYKPCLCSLKMGATVYAKSFQMPHDHVSLAPGLPWERQSKLAQTWTCISVIPGLCVGEDTSHRQEHGDSKLSGTQTLETHTSVQHWGKLWKTLGKSSFELLTSPRN